MYRRQSMQVRHKIISFVCILQFNLWCYRPKIIANMQLVTTWCYTRQNSFFHIPSSIILTWGQFPAPMFFLVVIDFLANYLSHFQHLCHLVQTNLRGLFCPPTMFLPVARLPPNKTRQSAPSHLEGPDS